MEHTHHILSSIRKIVRVVNLESKQLEKDYNISIPQLLTLKFLYEQKDYCSIHKEIKNYLQLNASTVTGIISRLEKKGVIAKKVKEEDKRTTLIILTAKGLELVKSVPEPLHKRLSNSLKKLSEHEMLQLQAAFEIIVNFLDAASVDAWPMITAEAEMQMPYDKHPDEEIE